MSGPIVSVIVPTKNSSKTLLDCLKSVKNQSYKNVELIVVDNFSTDDTPKIAKQHADIFFSKGPERSAQRNFGVSKSKGKYVFIIDSDMVLSAQVISSCVEAMEGSQKHSGVIVPEESFGEGFWAQCKKLERSFYVGISYMEAARFFKRIDFENLNGYNVEMVSGEDWDISQRIAQLGTLTRINDYIFHNEGKISLFQTIKKKLYYAKLINTYVDSSRETTSFKKQTSIVGRYSLFFSKPKVLFKNPALGLGMLFMKTSEFLFGGIGYVMARIAKK